MSQSATNTSASQSPPLASTTGTSFEGLDINTGCGGSCFPPDVTVAGGPNHVVEMVNIGMQIWDKSGNSLLTVPLIEFLWNK